MRSVIEHGFQTILPVVVYSNDLSKINLLVCDEHSCYQYWLVCDEHSWLLTDKGYNKTLVTLKNDIYT